MKNVKTSCLLTRTELWRGNISYYFTSIVHRVFILWKTYQSQYEKWRKRPFGHSEKQKDNWNDTEILEEQQTFESWVSSGLLDKYWLLPCLRGLQSLQLLMIGTLGISHGWHSIDIIAVDFQAWSELVMILLTWGSACQNQQGSAHGKGYVNSWKPEVVCFLLTWSRGA